MSKVKMLKLMFPDGEDSSVCDKIAKYADTISNYRCSSGGFEVTRMPITKEDEEEFGMEFNEEIMSYSYEYKKENK